MEVARSLVSLRVDLSLRSGSEAAHLTLIIICTICWLVLNVVFVVDLSSSSSGSRQAI